MQIQTLANKIEHDPALRALVQANPEEAIRTVAAGAPLQTDVTIYRMVVGSLGGTLLVCVIGAVVLAVYGKPAPEILGVVAGGAVGALAGLLAPSPVRA